jgi:hypothetical protein
VIEFVPRNVLATTARQLCKATHQHFKDTDTTVVHLKDADLPFYALLWAFLHRITTI